MQFQTLVNSFRKCHTLTGTERKEKGMLRYTECFVLLKDVEAMAERWTLEQSESCLPGGDVYNIEEKRRVLVQPQGNSIIPSDKFQYDI
jgi:hypothetical protein